MRLQVFRVQTTILPVQQLFRALYTSLMPTIWQICDYIFTGRLWRSRRVLEFEVVWSEGSRWWCGVLDSLELADNVSILVFPFHLSSTNLHQVITMHPTTVNSNCDNELSPKTLYKSADTQWERIFTTTRFWSVVWWRKYTRAVMVSFLCEMLEGCVGLFVACLPQALFFTLFANKYRPICLHE